MYACYIVFNSEKIIASSLHSIIDYVDKVIMVDGAFADHAHITPHSTDKTKSIAEKICGKKLIWVDCKKVNNVPVPWKDQIEKRNAYLSLIPHDEWFIVVDDDEIFYGNMRVLRYKFSNGNCKCMKVRMLNFYPAMKRSFQKGAKDISFTWLFPIIADNKQIPTRDWFDKEVAWIGVWGNVSCIYKKHKDMEYKKSHSSIYINDEVVVADNDIPLKDIIIINQKFLVSCREYVDDVLYKRRRL